MNILLTGAFGNIGRSTLEELLLRGHQVRCFDIRTQANERTARQYAGRAEIFWGDLRSPQDIATALQGQEVVLHLAFVIPRLSTTGRNCEDCPDWSREINVGGTRNLIEAMQAMQPSPRLLFTSSLHIYGRTQDQTPPRRITDLPCPIEHYAHHKVECEQMVRASGLDATIFRLGAALPVRLIMDPGMFDLPLDNRIEFVHTRDVGFAIANALNTPQVWGKTLHIGGGPRCQLYYRDMLGKILDAAGILKAAELGRLPMRAFAHDAYSVDWLDTQESQALLHFQRYTLDDYTRDLRQKMGSLRDLVLLFRPLLRSWLLRYSPYLKK